MQEFQKQKDEHQLQNSKGFQEEESLIYSDSEAEFEVEADPDGDKKLCGSSLGTDIEESKNSCSEPEKEKGQITDSDGDTDRSEVDEEIQKCLQEGNVNKLKRILKRKEEENSKLKKDLQRE